MRSIDPTDPIVVAAIERALAPYRGLVPPAVLEVMREELEETLTEHPVGSSLVKRLQPRAAPDRSGDVDEQGQPVDGAADETAKAGGAG